MLNDLKSLVPRALGNKIKLFLHRGDKYTCPFCNSSLQDLQPFGLDLPVLREKGVVGAGRRNSVCYVCGSTDRERLVYLFLKDHLNIFTDSSKSILHIAPEDRLSARLRRSGFTRYICGDLFTAGYSYPDYVCNIDVVDIPYPDKTFDLVICNHVLEHIPADFKAMSEIHRVLKPGGKAVLQVPLSTNSEITDEDVSVTDPAERERRFGQHDHVRLYGRDYFKRLEMNGFTVEEVDIASNYPKYGLNKDERVFVGVKPLPSHRQ